jgi:SAM-dependent methyltransferase
MPRISAVEGYAWWADTWEAAPSPIMALEQRLLLPWIERLHPRRTDDVGCGTGRWAAPLAAIALDASPAMLAVASRKPALRGQLAVADAAALPIASRCRSRAVHPDDRHVRQRAAVMKEIARIVETDGTLILTGFHPAVAAQGWRRTFRHDRQVYELQNYPYILEQLRESAPALVLRECLAAFGEPERAIFQQAGKLELFEAAHHIPAVLLTLWGRA